MDKPVKFEDMGGFKEALTIRYSRVDGEAITREDCGFIQRLPVDAMDLIAILLDHGLKIVITYPPDSKPRVFPKDTLQVRTGDLEFMEIPVPLDIPIRGTFPSSES